MVRATPKPVDGALMYLVAQKCRMVRRVTVERDAIGRETGRLRLATPTAFEHILVVERGDYQVLGRVVGKVAARHTADKIPSVPDDDMPPSR